MTDASPGRVLALDVGDRRIGVALSDATGVIAQPLTTLHRSKQPDADLDALAALIGEHGVTTLVVGWPLRLDGRPTPQTRKVERFTAALEQRTGLVAERWDERLSTVAAERALLEGNVRRAQRKQVVDKVAATLILQGFLDARAWRARRAGDD